VLDRMVVLNISQCPKTRSPSLDRESTVKCGRIEFFAEHRVIGRERHALAAMKMFQDSLVKIHVFRSERRLGQAAAAMAAELIRTAIKDRGRTFLVIATGKSQENFLAALVQIRDILVALDQKCRQQQVGEGWFPAIADVPGTAVSMSIHQIRKSCE